MGKGGALELKRRWEKLIEGSIVLHNSEYRPKSVRGLLSSAMCPSPRGQLATRPWLINNNISFAVETL